MSLDALLLSDGDGRMVLGADGRSRYGCAPHPTDALPLGSCTASSPSPVGIAAAAAAWQALREDGDTERAGAQVRAALSAMLGLEALPQARVVLAPSGTDAELLAVWLVRRGQSVCNIVVAPEEIGSGSVLAAGGRYFDGAVPAGGVREKGAPLPGMGEGITVETVVIRNRSGRIREPADIDAQVVRLVAEQVAAGKRVLVHMVAHSKTGVHAPRWSVAQALRRAWPEQVEVIVDAAQGRFSRRGLRIALQDGFLVITTGSKFYGGPPFSGALLVPGRLAPAEDAVVPAGFADFFARWQWPADWTARQQLPEGGGRGLLIRWAAALAEMRSYYEASGQARLAVLRAFERTTPAVLQTAQSVALLPIYPPVSDDEQDRLLESKTTVFGFRMRRLDQPDAPWLDRAALRQVGRWMNRDCADQLPEGHPDRAALTRCFHLGQPVALGGGAVLRVAIGGVLITRVAEDAALGATLPQRLGWLQTRLGEVAGKLDAIARSYGRLAGEER